jgi:hypothetical protein
MSKNALYIILLTLILCSMSAAQEAKIQSVGGTLVVAVPVREGLVTCSDRRLFNETTGTYTDDFVKIHKVGNNALFVATNTTGFLDNTTGKMEFDVFEIAARYASDHEFAPGRPFWEGLKKEIRDQLSEYLAKRKYNEWPATDTANNNLLFNLVFYAIANQNIRSYSISVFYEKAPTPVIYIPDVVSEEVRTPKLLGKGKIVMSYLAINPALGRDPSILRFSQGNFEVNKTTTQDAIDFAGKLFILTNKALPGARVSATYDCALLSFQKGFQWIDSSYIPAQTK